MPDRGGRDSGEVSGCTVPEVEMSSGGTSSFEPVPAAAAAARRLVVTSLAGCEPTVVADAELVTSELATNAILHAGTPFTVAVSSRSDGAVRVAVSDGSRGLPVVRPPTAAAAGGRGLQIVDSLCRRWGVLPAGVPGGPAVGKTVWCEL